MKKLFADKQRKIVIFLLILSLILSASFGSYAWFADLKEADLSFNARIHGSYFEYGDGSEEDPFGIARPVQLYYLAWLQELGYFNTKDGDTTNIKQTFFELSDAIVGTGNPIDMAGWVIPSIGTKNYPFVGGFNGNGIVIENITVTNDKEALKENMPDTEFTGVEISGLFGVVGSMNDDGTVNARCGQDETPTSGYTYDDSKNSIENVYLKNISVSTTTSTALVGTVAGYLNANISDVGVVGSSITIAGNPTPDNSDLTSNISNYSIIGYCTEAFRESLSIVDVDIDTPAAKKLTYVANAQGNAWGGSIDMVTLVQRLKTIKNNYQLKQTGGSYLLPEDAAYISAETIFIDPNNGTETRVTTATSRTPIMAETGNKMTVYYSPTDTSGTYYFRDNSSTNDNSDGIYRMHVNGYSDVGAEGNINDTRDTVTTITISSNTVNAYYISNGSNYLGINNNGSAIQNTTDQTVASKWITDSSNHLYTYSRPQYIDNKVSGGYDLVYLNVANGALSVSGTATTAWNYDSVSGSYYTIADGQCFYINFNGTTWQALAKQYYTISDGTNYLTATTSATGTTTAANSAAKWYMENNKLYKYSGTSSTKYYLRWNNNSLTVSNSETNGSTWTSTTTGLRLSTSGTNYLIYKNGVWTVGATSEEVTGYKIRSVSNYLSINNNHNGLQNTNNANATTWLAKSGKIGTTINGTTYYLNHTNTNNGNLSIASDNNSADSWTADGNKLYVKSNNYFHYIRFNNTSWINSRDKTQKTAKDAGTDLTFDESKVTINYNPGKLSDPQGETPNNNSRTLTTSFTVSKTSEKIRSGVATYFPLAVNGNADDFTSYTNNPSTTIFDAANSNTGYIVGASYSSGSNGSYIGDTRIASYDNSLASGVYEVKNGKLTLKNVRTITTKGSVDSAYIMQNGEIKDDSLVKFESSLATLQNNMSQDTGHLCGIHFDGKEVSTDRLITAPKVLINGEEIENYDLPEGCVDFNLKQQGYINFFAGTYGSGSGSYRGFFALYYIIREESIEMQEDGTEMTFQRITGIKKISEIYGVKDDPSAEYIYKFSDGTQSQTANLSDKNTYELLFSTSVIEDQGKVLSSNQVYYFEIPANKGEYALGSFNGNGAYLMYLDISAAQQTVDRIQISEEITSSTSTYEYPTGVAYVDSVTAEIDDRNSVAASIASGNGTYTESRTGDNVSIQGTDLVYNGDGITVTGITVPDPVQTITRRITYLDYNQTTKVYSKQITTIESTGTDNTVTSSIWLKRNGDTDYTPDVIIYTFDFVGSAPIYSSAYTFDASSKSFDLSFLTTTSFDVTMTTISDGYSVTINGTKVLEGETVAAEATDNTFTCEVWDTLTSSGSTMHYVKPGKDTLEVDYEFTYTSLSDDGDADENGVTQQTINGGEYTVTMTITEGDEDITVTTTGSDITYLEGADGTADVVFE